MSQNEAMDLWSLAASRAPTTDEIPEPRRSICVWRALAGGQLQFVECFERDGIRYYVFRAYPVDGKTAPLLGARERQVVELVGAGTSEKVIGLVLGMPPSTVSSLLHTSLRKLGLQSRVDLILLTRSLQVRPVSEPVR